jgi:hypothetical protein
MKALLALCIFLPFGKKGNLVEVAKPEDLKGAKPLF